MCNLIFKAASYSEDKDYILKWGHFFPHSCWLSYKNQSKAVPKPLEGNHAIIETNATRARKKNQGDLLYCPFYRDISLNMSCTVMLRYRVKGICL